jgi:hypothetical protein
MKSIAKNIMILTIAAALVLVGISGVVAGSQSNGNSIYEDGIDKLISQNSNPAGVSLVVSSKSNGNSIYEDGIDKLISMNTDSAAIVARSQSNGNSIYEDNLGKLVG